MNKPIREQRKITTKKERTTEGQNGEQST